MCYNCKNQVFGTFEAPVGGCNNGNEVEFKQWWDENADKMVSEQLPMPACFQPTQFSLMAEQMKNDGFKFPVIVPVIA